MAHAIPQTKEHWAGMQGNCLGLFLLEVSGPRVFAGIGLIVTFMCFYCNSLFPLLNFQI